MGSAVYYQQYTGSELGTMLIDVVGNIFSALASNGGTIATLFVIVLVVALAVDALTGVFGILKFLKGKK